MDVIIGANAMIKAVGPLANSREHSLNNGRLLDHVRDSARYTGPVRRFSSLLIDILQWISCSCSDICSVHSVI